MFVHIFFLLITCQKKMDHREEEMTVRDDVDDLCDAVSNINVDLKLDKDGQLFIPQEKIRSEQEWMEICQKRWPHDWTRFRADPRMTNLTWEQLYKRVDDANVGLCVRMPSLVGIPPIFRQNQTGMPKLNNLTKMNSVIPLGVTEMYAFCLAQEKKKEKYWLYFCSVHDMLDYEKISVVNLKKVEERDLVCANPVYHKFNQPLPFDGPLPSCAAPGQEEMIVDNSKQPICPVSHFAIYNSLVYLYDQEADVFLCCDVSKKKAPIVIPRQPTKCSAKCMRQIVVSRHYMAVVYDHTLPDAGSPEGAYVQARFETPLEEEVKLEVDMENVFQVMQREYVCSFIQLYWLGSSTQGLRALDICMPNRERKKQESGNLEMSLAELAQAHQTDASQTIKTKKKEENVLFTFHQIRCVAFHETLEDALFVSVDDGAVFRLPIAEPHEMKQTDDSYIALKFLSSSISSGVLHKVDMGPSEEQDLELYNHNKVSYKTSGRQPARWLYVGGQDSLDNCVLLQGCESMMSGFMFGAFSEDKHAPDGHKQLAISRDTNSWRCVHACANLFVAHSIKDNNAMIGRLTDFGAAQRMGDIQTVYRSPSVDSAYKSVHCFADRIVLQQPNGSIILAFPSDMSGQELKLKALREHNANQNKMKT